MKLKFKRRRRSRRTPHTRRGEARGLVHVTLRLCEGLPQLRTPRTYRVLERVFREAKERNGMRLIAYSVMGNHLHLIVEPQGRLRPHESEEGEQLSRGMQGLGIRMAKALNKLWGRKGPQGRLRPHETVWADRFHSVLLETYWQIRKAFRYVLQNFKKHGYVPKSWTKPDRYSSGPWFQWCDWNQEHTRPLREPPVVKPRSWKWIPHVSLTEYPGQHPALDTPELA